MPQVLLALGSYILKITPYQDTLEKFVIGMIINKCMFTFEKFVIRMIVIGCSIVMKITGKL